MIDSTVITKLLNEKESEEVIEILYKGFIGRGINGVGNKSIRIRSMDDKIKTVSTMKVSQYNYKTNILDLNIELKYIKATFIDYKKAQYDEEWKCNREKYSIVIPYESIESIEIMKIS